MRCPIQSMRVSLRILIFLRAGELGGDVHVQDCTPLVALSRSPAPLRDLYPCSLFSYVFLCFLSSYLLTNLKQAGSKHNVSPAYRQGATWSPRGMAQHFPRIDLCTRTLNLLMITGDQLSADSVISSLGWRLLYLSSDNRASLCASWKLESPRSFSFKVLVKIWNAVSVYSPSCIAFTR